MCQIILRTYKNIEKAIKDVNQNMKYDLDLKGGDGYSITFIGIGNAFDTISYRANNYEEVLNKIKKDLIKLQDNFEKYVAVVGFSRQIPEMEENRVLLPPYGISDMIWMHGTISNEEELIKKLKIKNLRVDSEILMYLDPFEKEISLVNGLITYLRLYEDNEVQYILDFEDRGMGLWREIDPDIADLSFMTTDKNFENKDNIQIKNAKVVINFENKKISGDYNFYKFDENIVNIFSFSGGMDIALNTYDVLRTQIAKKNIFIYFDYGSRAKERELESVEKYIDYIKKTLNIDIELKIINVSWINQIGYNKLTDLNAKADENETEGNSQYVPYRNTIFSIMIGNYIDEEIEKSNFNKDWKFIAVFGFNLTEGQTHGDNNSAWFSSLKHVLSHGGKFYKNFDVLSPFANYTKTNTIKKFKEKYGEKILKDILEISFSCYYPKENGNPCGECGSCILRNRALERAGVIF